MAWRSPELGVNVADALLRARTINWSEWASVERRRESHYQRLQRFFRQTWMKSPPSVAFLNLWQFGKCVFNLLVWGVLGGSYSLSTIPNQRGHSHTPGWDAVVPPLLRRVAQLQLSHVSADRDLLGHQWWSYLNCPQTPFRLQIRENHQLVDGKHSWKVSTQFQDLQPTPSPLLRQQGRLGGDGP